MWTYSIPHGTRTKLVAGDRPGIFGKLSPDGHWLAIMSRDAGPQEVFVLPFPSANGRWQISTAGGVTPRWRRDGKELYYIAPDGKMMAVDISTTGGFRAGVPHPLFVTRLSPVSGFQYDVSRDGRFLLNNRFGDSSEPITVVTNWIAALKQ
jgi:Tol biopolymer transport system component